MTRSSGGGGARGTGPALEAMYQLVRWLIPTVERFPRRQKFLLGDRIQSTALAGLERLVEATFTRSRSRLLDRVNVDLDKLRLLLRLAKELGYLDARRYEHFRNRFSSVLRCDVYRYFPAIDHEILKALVRRRVRCDRTLRIIDAIIDGSNPQEPVYRYYPGDDLLTPFERRRGLPIGNLTSQLFANVYLDGLDHFAKERLRARGYLRYVDDFALFHDDPDVLEGWRLRIEGYLARRRLSLHPRKTWVAPTRDTTTFLGYVLLPDGQRRLPDENVRRFRGRLRSLRDRVRAGAMTPEDARPRVASWVAHARHANTRRLRRALFRGGPFDPAADRLSGRPAASPGGSGSLIGP